MILVLIISYFFGTTVPKPVIGLIVATVALVWYWRKYTKAKQTKGLKELPGPSGLPFIGNAHQLGSYPNAQYSKWAQTYGNMYKVKLGNQLLVVVSDAKLTKELFNDSDTTGRLHAPVFSIYEQHPGLGIFSSEGEVWEVHRRFLLRQLRDFGFGKSKMEPLILDELTQVLARFKATQGKPVSGIREDLRLAVVNSLWTILTSNKFKHDDPTLLKLAMNTSKVFNDITEKGSLLIFFPWIKNIFPKRSGYTAIRDVCNENKSLFEKTIKEHKLEFQEDNLRDYIDVYLAEVKKTSDPNSVFYGDFAERQLVAELFDLFFAGSDSTAITFTWTILYMCKYPHIQKKFQNEIIEVTGKNDRLVSLSDRPNMPFTLALIDEVFRCSSLTPDGVAHRTLIDKEFHGYFIPKDALLQSNLHLIHHDPKIWGDPEEFRPERFLSPDGRKYVKNENVLPFLQIGKRSCVGESLARDSIFLYVTNIFKRFSVKFCPNSKEPTLDAEPGFLRSPQDFSAIFTDRFGVE